MISTIKYIFTSLESESLTLLAIMLQLYKAINLSYKGEQWENIRLSLEPAEKLAVEGITMKKRDAFLFYTKLSTFEAILWKYISLILLQTTLSLI